MRRIFAVLIVESLERFGDDLLGFDPVVLGQLLDSVVVDVCGGGADCWLLAKRAAR